jgi:hypothetical protein
MAKQPKKEVEDLGDSFKDLRDTLKSITQELFKKINNITDAKKEYTSLLNIAKQFQNNEEEISQLNDKQVKDLQSKAESNLRDLKTSAERLAVEKGVYTTTSGTLRSKVKLSQEEKVLLKAARENFSVEQNLLKAISAESKLRDQINKKTGVTGVLLKGMSQIPIVGELLKTDEALEAARNKAKETGSSIQAMGAAFGSMGKSLLTSLKDPLVMTGLIVKGFQELIKIGFAADQQVTDLSKSMATSKDEAKGVRDRMVEIQNSSNNVLMTTKNQVASQLELADAFGATRGFTEQQVEDQVNLTKAMKLSAEEASGIQQLAMANGQSAEDVTNSVIKQTSALAKQKGIQLDNKKVIGEVAKVSGQLRLQYQNNPALIAKAVVQANKLGISLDQAKKAASGLLDFEQSIESELTAELLTGKNLNLEKARSLALEGKSAEAAGEMLKQVGSAADFAKMNVIQQDALAKAVGMSSDELANSLVYQENLNKLGDQTKQQIQERVEALKAQGKMDEANQLMASVGNEKEAQAALTKISAQDRFNAAMEKLQATVTSIVEGPAMNLVNMIASLASNTKALKLLFGGIAAIIAGIKLTSLISGLVSALATSGALAATTAATASALTLGVGAIAVVGGIVAIMAAVSSAKSDAKANDGFFPSAGGSGYGKRTLLGPEGAIQLNNKDSVIAGTDLFGSKSSKGNDVVSTAEGSIKIGGGGGDMAAVVNAISQLRADLNALASRPINVSIDGTKVIEATTGANPNADGDAMRKNSYKVQ